MSKLAKVAKALSFAHLTGFAGKQAEENDKDRREEAEENDPDKDEQDRENINSKKSQRAEDEDKDRAEDGDPDDDEKDEGAKKAKGSKADDEDAEDEDDDDEMRGKSAAASARRRERARCAAIFGSKAAGRNPVLAANLAFNTNMTRKEALAVLESTPAAAGGGELAQGRAARNPGIGAGSAPSPSRSQQTASRWDVAFKKASGRR
jgi:hypothetical protein